MNFNESQLKAVEHGGGLSLSAGAGSGKTTVIVGHIIYKIQKYLDSKGSVLSSIDLSDFLKRIVVMTYTKKAAAELETRLKKAIYNLKEKEGWSLVEIISMLEQYMAFAR
jgi:superfamily I DNA/RNA helicase